jgi:hypothetical protein
MVRHRMFSGESLAPGFSGLMRETTYPAQPPFADPVTGHGCFARKARTGAGLLWICPFKSRTQLAQAATCLCGGSDFTPHLEIVPGWAFKMAQNALAMIPIRNRSG